MSKSEESALFAVIGKLQDCARRGDWKNAFAAAIALRDSAPPASVAEASRYLERLREALIVAKASRSHLSATLARVNAAARFANARTTDRSACALFSRMRTRPRPPRQEFGESPEN